MIAGNVFKWIINRPAVPAPQRARRVIWQVRHVRSYGYPLRNSKSLPHRVLHFLPWENSTLSLPFHVLFVVVCSKTYSQKSVKYVASSSSAVTRLDSEVIFGDSILTPILPNLDIHNILNIQTNEKLRRICLLMPFILSQKKGFTIMTTLLASTSETSVENDELNISEIPWLTTLTCRFRK